MGGGLGKPERRGRSVQANDLRRAERFNVRSELDRVSQALTGRIRQLAERYAAPLPQLAAEVDALSARVEEHSRRMGAVV